jgi:hypothetical protein
MRLFLGQARSSLSAVAIGASKDDVRSFVHGLNALMTLQTAATFCAGLCLRLINPIPSRKRDLTPTCYIR